MSQVIAAPFGFVRTNTVQGQTIRQSIVLLLVPEMVILREVLTVRLIAVFVGVVGAGILLVGYLFNLLL